MPEGKNLISKHATETASNLDQYVLRSSRNPVDERYKFEACL